MKRDFSRRKYVAAFLFTIVIFMLGLSLGLLFDTGNIEKINEANRKQSLDYVSLQLQYSFLDRSNVSCAALNTALYQNLLALDKSLNDVSNIRESNILSKDKYRLIERQYTLDNLNYLLLSQRAREMCNVNNSIILYFYSEDCLDCPSQGIILTYLKDIFQERLLVFPLNANLEEPIIRILGSKYNITRYPSLVVKERRYEGVVEKEELLKLVCDGLGKDERC